LTSDNLDDTSELINKLNQLALGILNQDTLNIINDVKISISEIDIDNNE
jgi:hypothetical protein